MSSYVVGGETMDRVLFALSQSGWKRGDWPDVPKVLQNVGAIVCTEPWFRIVAGKLYDLNVRAFQGRYPNQNESDATTVQYLYQHHAVAETPIRAFKAVQCFTYQCAEEATIADPLYIAMERYELEVAAMIVAGLPEYEQAPWG